MDLCRNGPIVVLRNIKTTEGFEVSFILIDPLSFFLSLIEVVSCPQEGDNKIHMNLHYRVILSIIYFFFLREIP